MMHCEKNYLQAMLKEKNIPNIETASASLQGKNVNDLKHMKR